MAGRRMTVETGRVVIVNRENKVLYHSTDCNKMIASHSTAKLIQVLPVYLTRLNQYYNFTPDELAIMSSSHLAQTQHVQVLERILEKTGLNEDDMVLHISAPTGRLAYENWMRQKQCKRKLYHPCSGNHIAMMLVQRELTGSVFGYEKKDSAVQQCIAGLMCYITECPKKRFHISTDNCGVPLYEIPIRNIAIAYKNMVCTPDKFQVSIARAIRQNISALRQNPLMLEGDQCLSTIITSHNGMVAKTGYGGLLAIGIPQYDVGIVIQAAEHTWSRAAELTYRALKRIGIKNEQLSHELEYIMHMA